MSIQSEAINSILDICDSMNLFSPVHVGQLGEKQDIACYLTSGRHSYDFFDRGSIQILPLTFLSKHLQQQTARDSLHDIANKLTRMQSYPSSALWEIINVREATTPRLIGKDQSTQHWNYASVLEIELLYKGE